MTWDWASFGIGVLVGLGLLTLGIVFDVDDWFHR